MSCSVAVLCTVPLLRHIPGSSTHDWSRRSSRTASRCLDGEGAIGSQSLCAAGARHGTAEVGF